MTDLIPRAAPPAQEQVELTPTEIDDLLAGVFTPAEDATVQREFAALNTDTAVDGAAAVAEDLGSQTFTNADTAALRVYKDRRASTLAGINRTTRRQLQAALKQGAADKATPSQLRAAVAGVFDQGKRVRAPMIGRQEAGTAWSVGTRSEMLLQAVPGRFWVTQQDEKVRDAHEELEGKCAAIDEAFEDGDGNLLMFPRDPAAPPETVMNCRCFEEAIAGGCDSQGMRERLTNPQRLLAWWRAQNRKLRGHERIAERVIRRRFNHQRAEALRLLEHFIR